MTLKEAIWQRHTVRKYEDRAISIEHTQLLEERINENNQKYGLKLKLILNNKLALNTFIKLFYLVIKKDSHIILHLFSHIRAVKKVKKPSKYYNKDKNEVTNDS